jgi:formate hydrogenlyase subunit 3/multisubunit Na+/H+ antiporter MnhD subunit
MELHHIFGIISLMLAGLIGYWLMTPSPQLAADPLNSLALIIFALVFLASGIFMILYGYILTDSGE